MPVLPEVPSMIVPPGFSSPCFSASSIIRTAMRSLIELPGLNVSSLTSTVAGMTPRVIELMRTIGVPPMASRIVLQIGFKQSSDGFKTRGGPVAPQRARVRAGGPAVRGHPRIGFWNGYSGLYRPSRRGSGMRDAGFGRRQAGFGMRDAGFGD